MSPQPPQNQTHFKTVGKELCSEEDCFKTTDEYDREVDSKGNVYAPSLKCWDCRTLQDRKKIKAWRKRHRIQV